MGVLLKSNDKYIVEGDGLIINDIEESDDGSYSCEVIVLGTGEYKSRSINLEVSDISVDALFRTTYERLKPLLFCCR